MRLTFKRLALLSGQAARGAAKLVGLTPARLDFLCVIKRGALCQKQIAERLCCSEPVVSRMVRALVELGLVRRFVLAHDRRFRFVELTPEGEQKYEELTHCASLLHPNGDDCIQAVGESRWLFDYWTQKALDELGLQALSEMYPGEDRGHGEWKDCPPDPRQPPYDLFRQMLDSRHFDDPFDCVLFDWEPPERKRYVPKPNGERLWLDAA